MTTKNKKQAAKTSVKDDKAIEKFSPVRSLSSFEDVEKMFDDFFSRGWMSPFHFSQPSLSHLHSPLEVRTTHFDVVERDN